MAKSANAFRTIREVSEWLDTPAHVLRFWESKFRQVSPVKRAGGRRYYRPADMFLLGGLKKLLHEDNMSIKDAARFLKTDGIKAVQALSRPLEETGSGQQDSDVTPTKSQPEPALADLHPDAAVESTVIPEASEGAIVNNESPVNAAVDTPETSLPEQVSEPAQLSLPGTPDPVPLSVEKPVEAAVSLPEKPAKRPDVHSEEVSDVTDEPNLFSLMEPTVPETPVQENQIVADDQLSDLPAHAAIETEIPTPAETPAPDEMVAASVEVPQSEAPGDTVVPSTGTAGTSEEPEGARAPEPSDPDQTDPVTAQVTDTDAPDENIPDAAIPMAIETAAVPEDPADDAVFLREQPVLTVILNTAFPMLVSAGPALEVATTRLETLRNRMASR
ncbi:MerR family transcriptional regulator [Thalassobius sp. I31.1]|uniref:MerR family transcriptional regulator n=1 Tax=Thalassobius sp. I31.1 TaxID=2109912 RepID=UPI000D1B99F1|nr:MerR family transcriptional regulator [Thalassobius sp. I31.1]